MLKVNVITKHLTDSEILDQIRQMMIETEEAMEGTDSSISKIMTYDDIRDLLGVEYQPKEEEEVDELPNKFIFKEATNVKSND